MLSAHKAGDLVWVSFCVALCGSDIALLNRLGQPLCTTMSGLILIVLIDSDDESAAGFANALH